MILLVSYDLNGRERPASYAAVKEVIEKNCIAWAKPLYSQWFVETSSTPAWWSETLKLVMDANDRLFISQVVRGYSGWLNQEIWDWLNPRV